MILPVNRQFASFWWSNVFPLTVWTFHSFSFQIAYSLLTFHVEFPEVTSISCAFSCLLDYTPLYFHYKPLLILQIMLRNGIANHDYLALYINTALWSTIQWLLISMLNHAMHIFTINRQPLNEPYMIHLIFPYLSDMV